MTKIRTSFVFSVLTLSGIAAGQTFIGPFQSPHKEFFDTIQPGNGWIGFSAFGGRGSVNRLGTGGSITVTNNHMLLLSLSPYNAIFGRDSDVVILLNSRANRFGGFFRVPETGFYPRNVTFKFYQGGNPIGQVSGLVIRAAWTWFGYDLFFRGGFDKVEILGDAFVRGYIGMDSLVIA